MNLEVPFPAPAIDAQALSRAINDRSRHPWYLADSPPKRLRGLCSPHEVSAWLNLIRQRVADPVRIAQCDGTRWVQVLGPFALQIRRDATLAPVRWQLRPAPRWLEVPPQDVGLLGLPPGWAWLDAFRAAFEARLRERLGNDRRVRPFADWVFVRFRARLRRDADLAGMHRRIAEALALDPQLLAIARRILFASGPAATLPVSAYNEVVAHRADYEKLAREAPALLPLFARLRAQLPARGEPAQRLRAYLRDLGLSEATWRLLHHGGTRLLKLLDEFYKHGSPWSVLDLLWIVELLSPAGRPPFWFVRTVLHQFGNHRQRRLRYRPAVEPLQTPLRRLAQLAQRADARQCAAMQAHLHEVLGWLVEDEAAARHPHLRRAPWRWFERRALQWCERALFLAQQKADRWPVPFDRLDIGNHTVVALHTPGALWDEGLRMRHCARTFVEDCARGQALIFSIRRAGRARPLATMCAMHEHGWQLGPFSGCANTAPEPAVWRVAQRVVDLLNALGWEPPAAARDAAPHRQRESPDPPGAPVPNP
ncbi:MAG: PcfJ domain-containing protein [Burkholderiaceae bacterium]|nr:PcfJ domain-containing protein [Burkholderiaceae bacterium]